MTSGTPHGLASVVAALGADVAVVDEDARRAAARRFDGMAKPPGSLGALEALGAQLAAIAGACPPEVVAHPALLVAAGDHGVHARGVTRWPQEVTAAVVDALAAGRATAAVLAADAGCAVRVLDVGVAGAVADSAALVAARTTPGTRDIVVEPAMPDEVVGAALEAGATAAAALIEGGADLLVLGEVGIANTTSTAALAAALTGRDPAAVTGAGASNDAATVARKVAVVSAALRRHGPGRDPLGLLQSLGGAEHAALLGAALAAAGARVPVVLDGVTTAVVAAAGVAVVPALRGYLIAGHRSPEPASTPLLDLLGIAPLLDLGLRVGEGTGGVLAVGLVRAAARALRDVAALADL